MQKDWVTLDTALFWKEFLCVFLIIKNSPGHPDLPSGLPSGLRYLSSVVYRSGTLGDIILQINFFYVGAWVQGTRWLGCTSSTLCDTELSAQTTSRTCVCTWYVPKNAMYVQRKRYWFPLKGIGSRDDGIQTVWGSAPASLSPGTAEVRSVQCGTRGGLEPCSLRMCHLVMEGRVTSGVTTTVLWDADADFDVSALFERALRK